jgi:hypothetical protein
MMSDEPVKAEFKVVEGGLPKAESNPTSVFDDLASLRKDPLLTNLQDDTRWNAFLHTMGLGDDQLKVSAR